MQGTIVLGDVALTLATDPENPSECSLSIQDMVSGRRHSFHLPLTRARAALCTAINGEEWELPQDLLDDAELAQPADPALRFIP